METLKQFIAKEKNVRKQYKKDKTTRISLFVASTNKTVLLPELFKLRAECKQDIDHLIEKINPEIISIVQDENAPNNQLIKGIYW